VTTILHVTTATEWERAREQGRYGAGLVERDGFLHFCTHGQLAGVLHRYFEGTEGLVALLVDAEQLGRALRWESTPPSRERFPHLYRALEVGEVTAVSPVDELLDAPQSLR